MGAVTVLWAREIARWTGRIDHEELQSDADRILLDAAAAGADLDDLQLIARAAYEAWRAQEPDPDETPAAAASATATSISRRPWTAPGGSAATSPPSAPPPSTAVLEALGKSRGPEDFRSAGQRYHDALHEGCELLIRAKWCPTGPARHPSRRHHPLGRPPRIDGASVVEDTWLSARAGEYGT